MTTPRPPRRRRRGPALIGTNLLGLALAALPAAAQDGAIALDPIIVSGGLTPIPAARYGRSVSVVTAEDIEARQITYVSEALRALPGVSVSRTGGAGGVTEVRIRGAENNHTLVLIDGVDVTAPENGGFDFGNLLAADIERIEVLRGPQSSIYGANAIGGVISITTKTASTPGFAARVEGEYASDASRGGLVALRQRTERARLSFSAARYVAEGYDISDDPGGEDDTDDNATYTARAEYDLTDSVTVGGTLRYVDRETDFDAFNFGAARTEDLVTDADQQQEREELFGTLYATIDSFGGRLQNELFASFLEYDDLQIEDGAHVSDTSSDRRALRYRGTLALDATAVDLANHTLSVLVEREDESFRNNDPALVFDPEQLDTQERRLFGYVLEYRGSFAEAVDLQASLRYDDNDAFDDALTYALGASWRLPNRSTRLHGSVGTGVQNPTLYDQFGFFPGSFIGNPDLEPEQSFGWDIGVEQSFLDGRGVIDVTYFQQKLTDEIVLAFDPVTFETSPFNADGTSDRQGIEVAAALDLDNGVSLALDYTWLDAEDPDEAREVRRPQHELGLRAFYALPNDRTLLGLDLRHVAGNEDFDFTAPSFGAERKDLGDYTLTDLTLEHRATDNLTLTARVENLFDTDYTEIDGYATPGRVFYAGLRAAF